MTGVIRITSFIDCSIIKLNTGFGVIPDDNSPGDTTAKIHFHCMPFRRVYPRGITLKNNQGDRVA